MSSTLDDRSRAAVESYVSDTLRSMPEHLRVACSPNHCSSALPTLVAHALGRDDDAALRARLEHWSTSRIDFVRQYVRLLHSLVLFAENELAGEAAVAVGAA